jgi:hypothetical protein
LLLPLLALAGCPDSHGVHEDGGLPGDGGRCAGGGGGGLICVRSCGSDAGEPPICTSEGWACPLGTVDIFTCPPTCWGPPPAGCTCEGTEWVCEPTTCPPGINPWNPDDPANVCSPDGSTCNSGGGSECGGGMWCTCESGRWNCAVAEPDPVCWCGREPEVGDRCNEEGMMCGECCPTAGGTGWDAMTCVDGRWTTAACPEIVCPAVAVSCPVDTAEVLGRTCSIEGAQCGDQCCSNHIICESGVWVEGIDADCLTCNSYECGGGLCNDEQYCNAFCGPADGIDYDCQPEPEDCDDCSCLGLPPSVSCTMIDGHPHVRELGFCG